MLYIPLDHPASTVSSALLNENHMSQGWVGARANRCANTSMIDYILL